MSDAKPTASEPESETAKLAGLNLGSDSRTAPNGTNPSAPSFTTPSKFSWADDEEPAPGKTEEKKDDLSKAQTDGASTWLHGSQGLDEPEFDVNVKLADLQEDPNNPLYSIKSFEELNL